MAINPEQVWTILLTLLDGFEIINNKLDLILKFKTNKMNSI